jgi:hypothetical protein
MGNIFMDDPFADYPELVKEREKARKLREREEKLGRPPSNKGGWRPGAGRKYGTHKTLYFKILINKEDEQALLIEIETLKEKYGNIA